MATIFGIIMVLLVVCVCGVCMAIKQNPKEAFRTAYIIFFFVGIIASVLLLVYLPKVNFT